MKQIRIAVIGAGASGLFASVTAAKTGAAVTVFEHGGEAGRKLLMTGNGKCNLTNERMGAQYYHSDSDTELQTVQSVLARFDEKKTVGCFGEMGLLTYSRDGYVYPAAEQAAAVRDVLLRECRLRGVHIRYHTDVYPLLRQEKRNGKFMIGNEVYDRLILACGGKSERQTGSDGSGFELAKRFGHSVRTPFPALVPLFTDKKGWQDMAGVRIKSRIRLLIDGKTSGEEYGELQITAKGISGIPVFQLSGSAVRALESGSLVEAELCFLPGRERREVGRLIAEMLSRERAALQTPEMREHGRAALQTPEMREHGRAEQRTEEMRGALTGIVNGKVLAYLLSELEEQRKEREAAYMEKTGNSEWEAADRQLAAGLTGKLFAYRIPVTGHAKLDHAQVTGGGIPFNEVTQGLASRLCGGLFFAGEMLDVDGICGGYNLQWAWSSGYTAAMSAVENGLA